MFDIEIRGRHALGPPRALQTLDTPLGPPSECHMDDMVKPSRWGHWLATWFTRVVHGGLRIVDKFLGESLNAYVSVTSQKNFARYARIHSLQINISNCLIIGLDFTSRTGVWSLGVRTLLRPSE